GEGKVHADTLWKLPAFGLKVELGGECKFDAKTGAVVLRRAKVKVRSRELGLEFDARTKAAVTAFQRHFRPERVDGIADASTIATLHKLLTALPEL
ncbi:MAG: peptidoglycan-binding domain-containing protein, partial [Pannonibacter indicus]